VDSSSTDDSRLRGALPTADADYDKKARELKDQQAEIAARIEQHQQGNAEYRTTLESLISLASRAVECSSVRKPRKSGNFSRLCFRTWRLGEKS
jgi:hypothetical protein